MLMEYLLEDIGEFVAVHRPGLKVADEATIPSS
jgi:hypothetical protein